MPPDREQTDQVEPASLPDGARDVLSVESAELAAIEASLRSAFGAFGYREVRTPLLEFADVMDRAQEGGLGRAFRLFDDHGQVLVIRPDLTIPVARLVAARLGDHPGPLRVSYVAERLRPAPAGRAQRAEERQAGIELVGLPGPAADAEVVALVGAALRALGVEDLRIALGAVSLTRAVLDGLGVAEAHRTGLQEAARHRNLVAWRRAAAALPLDPGARDVVVGLPSMRGGEALLARLSEAVPSAERACAELRATLDLIADHGLPGAVMIDLGVLRDWDYYSGVVFEAYAPGVGRPIAIGGRYDGLIGRFGAPRPAVGAAVLLDRLHEALAARIDPNGPSPGVVLAGGIEREVDAARAIRADGLTVVGVPETDGVAERLAEVEDWRFVARRDGSGFAVTDRASGATVRFDDLLEGLRSLRS